eukprot:gene19591-20037_t
MERLVEANSFPNVELGGAVGLTDKPDELAIDLDVENSGVGPARIETIELWENAKPLRSASDIGAAIKNIDGAHYTANIEGATVLESLIGAGKKRTFIRFRFSGIQKWYPTLTKFVFGMEKKGHPKPVKQCPTPLAPYNDNFADLALKNSILNNYSPSKSLDSQ